MKLLDFPELVQTYQYDCGAKVLQSILYYYGIEVYEEMILKYAKTNNNIGTLIINMEEVIGKFGLLYDSKKMSIDEMISYINHKIPVIILLQAWGIIDKEYSENHNGHWVVAIGYDENHIYFEDPYIQFRAYLGYDELLERWHAQEGEQIIYQHGIAVYGKSPLFKSDKKVHMD